MGTRTIVRQSVHWTADGVGTEKLPEAREWQSRNGTACVPSSPGSFVLCRMLRMQDWVYLNSSLLWRASCQPFPEVRFWERRNVTGCILRSTLLPGPYWWSPGRCYLGCLEAVQFSCRSCLRNGWKVKAWPLSSFSHQELLFPQSALASCCTDLGCNRAGLILPFFFFFIKFMNFRGRNLEKMVSLPQEWRLMLLLMPEVGVALLVIATNNPGGKLQQSSKTQSGCLWTAA